MSMLTIRNLPDEVHRALRAQAKACGRSTEAQVRALLTAAVMPTNRVLIGDAFMAMAKKAGYGNEDVDALNACIRLQPAQPLDLT